MKYSISIIALIIGLSIFSFTVGHFKPSIPKVWDLQQLQSMHLPYADSSVKLGFITEEEYNHLPERISYKTYPFYMPGSEPAGYYDSLSKLEAVVNFRAADLKTEADWIKAGELIYELPMNFTPLDSQMLSLLPVLAAKWKEAGIRGNKKDIIPFVVISIRKKVSPSWVANPAACAIPNKCLMTGCSIGCPSILIHGKMSYGMCLKESSRSGLTIN